MKAGSLMMRLVACVFALVLGTSSAAFADATSDTNAKIDALQKQLDAVKAQLDILKAQKAAPPPAAAPASGNSFLMLKKGDPFTLIVGGSEEVTLYGNLDISFDLATKGLSKFYPSSGDSPTGAVGYQPDISTNLSFIGVRGAHKLPHSKLTVPYQLETQLDISQTAGTPNSNSANDSVVKGALTSRNSYVGIASPYFGAFKIGKTDAPYKTSTARMNPFSSMIGDYSAVMGNTGGDNRVEFLTRLDHAVWYESPNWGGFTFNALATTGQNRAFDNGIIPSGQTSCAGGNVPGSGAGIPQCNDGSYGTVVSSNIAYQKKKLYLTAAYEIHKGVNRTGDLPAYDPGDVADEQAMKYGVQYGFGRGTTVSAIYENFKRYVPARLQYQNERQRDGYWLALSQALSADNTFNIGWAHANATPGDAPQHNTPAAGANPDNAANMYTAMIRHTLDKHFSLYAGYAMTLNHPAAHYDLGAGGRGVTTDCHDGSNLTAFDPTVNPPVSGAGPHCYAGGLLRAFSAGLNLKF